MTDFKVTKSGWYRTRDGRDAEVVINHEGGEFKVVGYVLGTTHPQSWKINGYCLSDDQASVDLIEYLGKERPKEPKKFKKTVRLYENGDCLVNGEIVFPGIKLVRTEIIEWEAPDNG